jgi:hypothetical protein
MSYYKEKPTFLSPQSANSIELHLTFDYRAQLLVSIWRLVKSSQEPGFVYVVS